MIKDEYGRVSDEILYDLADTINVNAEGFGSTLWRVRRIRKMHEFQQKQANRIYNIAYGSDLEKLAWTTLRSIESEFPYTRNVIPRDERVRLTVRAVANQTSQYYGALNATMLRSATNMFQIALSEVERRMLLATEAVTVGMATKQKVAKEVVDLVQKIGITGFVDKRGRKWSAEAYADLVMRSSMGNIQRQIMVDRCRDYDEDIVYAPIKYPSRPLCADWQGKLLSLSDLHYYTNDLHDRPMEVFPYSDAVGSPAGLWGCNCGHGHAVFIPSLSEVVEPVNKMTPEQNAEAYALTQQERELERNIRNNKTKVKMLEKAGVTGDDLEEAKNKLKQANNEYKGFLNKYGYDPTAGRTYVHGYKPSSPTTPKTPKTPTVPKTPTTPIAQKPATPEQKKYSEVEQKLLDDIKAKGVEYREVKKLENPLTEEDLIKKIGGGDLTKGSCASLSWAWAGNRNGYDVTDFRDGESRIQCAMWDHLRSIAKFDNVACKVVDSGNDVKTSFELLKSITENKKEYILVTGMHSSVVRKVEEGFEYLELQSARGNGWKKLDRESLRWRFDAKQSHSYRGWDGKRVKYEMPNFLFDVASLGKSDAFAEFLGYLNTDPDKQRKGASGHER